MTAFGLYLEFHPNLWAASFLDHFMLHGLYFVVCIIFIYLLFYSIIIFQGVKGESTMKLMKLKFQGL